MNTFTFIAFFGICMLSIANCEHFPGNLVIADNLVRNYNGLTVGGNLIVSGSGAVTVLGDASIAGNFDYSGSGVFHVTGVLTVQGKLSQHGSGAFTADGGIVSYGV